MEKLNNNCDSLNIFREITQIPRPSGNEEKMIDYLKHFSNKYNLKYECCGDKNIVIYKPATNGKNNTIILQAHLDMVCEKINNKDIDFNSQSIEIVEDDDYVWANGTSLGGDDGAGVALILHILKSKTLSHPNIEAIFTSQEETTMNGAKTLDYTLLHGTKMISLDGCREKEIESASAGMTDIVLTKKLNRIENHDKKFMVNFVGLKGGHSGRDINSGRHNANKIMAEFLNNLTNYKLCHFCGGDKDNTIPSKAKVIIKTEDEMQLFKLKDEFELKIKNESNDDEQFKIIINQIENEYYFENGDDLVNLISNLPSGTIKVNDDKFVVTSCNVAKVDCANDLISILISVRSSNKSFETDLLNVIKKSANLYNFDYKIIDYFAFFEENKHSMILNLAKNCYKNLFNDEVILKPTHGCLEGGIFYENIKNLDLFVMGCDLSNIHSTAEKLSKISLCRVEKWLESILEKI